MKKNNSQEKSMMTGISGASAPEFPVLHITDGQVSATVCLPDAEKGYYRGTRFDWNGVVCGLWSGEHNYVSQWQASHDPLCHDGLTGPADEFTQMGYNEACVGGEFLKIGVGTLCKSSGLPYDRFQIHEIIDPGTRSIVALGDCVEFRHLLQGKQYAYDYHKALRLTGFHGLRIEYELLNLGPEQIEGCVYNHNFFTLDNMATGPDTSICLPFRPRGTWRESYDSVGLTPTGIVFSRELRPGESVFMGDLCGHSLSTGEYGFSVRNLRTGAGVEVSGSGELSHTVFWACPTVACLEPYIRLAIHPGKTGVWHIDYKLLGTVHASTKYNMETYGTPE